LIDRALWIAGGGCYGRHYARQLLPALERGPWAGAALRVMDRNPECAAAAEPVAIEPGDWDETLDRLLDRDRAARGDWLVPAPLTPHLFARWLERALGSLGEVRTVEPPLLPDTPFARVTQGKLVFSFAEWRCPTHCIEPAICPATRQPKRWDLGRELASYAMRLRESGIEPLAGPFVARLAPIARGVSGFPLSDWTRAARRVRALVAGARPRSHAYVLAATASSCHGAASLLRLETKKAPASAGA
jgi:hypothetical protein